MSRASTASLRLRSSDFVALPEDDRREPVDGRLKPRAIPAKWHEFIVQHAQGDAVFRSKTFKGLKIPLGELWSVLPKR